MDFINDRLPSIPTLSSTSKKSNGLPIITGFQQLKFLLLSLHHHISTLPSLEPGPAADALFGTLVRICTQPTDHLALKLVRDDDIQTIRPDLIQLCSRAECLLERHYAQRALAADDTAAALLSFPYYANYKDLVRLEYHLLLGVSDPATPILQVAFLGSGPLPLTALILAQDHLPTTRFRAIDMDAAANELAQHLLARLNPGIGRRVHIITADAADVTDTLAECDVVFLAALVGLDREAKRAIVAHLAAYMRPGALLVVRSAHGMRQLLYPVVDDEDLVGFSVLVTAHPGNHVVNSVVIAKKMEG
ncbi:Nicotianamine synthase [Jimgerdemannia flammicorona]|uniref:Nicotianamine synthase n=1 Tax=Jimgerdemannia flammicorona TaxID=994334 RepID=A0A433Q365_9FUNG|nr:Nicotianamine synthase [Jimgerdemannia flammicorona]